MKILNALCSLIIMLFASSPAILAQTAPEPEWPKVHTVNGAQVTIYQPQLDSWDGFTLKGRVAVAVQDAGEQQPTYGVVMLSARTQVDKMDRMVRLQDAVVTDIKFPSAPEKATALREQMKQMAPTKIRQISLDRLEADMAVLEQKQKARPVPLRNDPPKILLSTTPAVLVSIDGEPKYASVQGADNLWRVLNTRVLLARNAAGVHYLHLYDGYMEAPALTGPWKAAQSPPADLKKAEKEARDSMQVDLLEGQPDPDTKAKPSLAALAPQVYVATTPTELIVTDGAPNFVPCGDTRLLYVKNTTAHVFKCMGDQKTYVLLSGRWFRAPSFAGPWEYVPAKSLPPDFAAIPDDSPKENVKAAVPGTPQSKEALIADSIPQTVEVDRAAAKFTPQIDGVPQLKPIEQTPLYYVVNSSAPIIKVNDQSWYACQNGVWFCAPALAGPWTVAASVPPVIYSIPPSSPLYYVTFCRVYGSTDQYVYEGYTPGYLGTTVSDDGVVVYGTGYSYDPWVGTVWYGPPVTYGLGCNICWTPWASWAYGYGFGWIVRPIWTYPPAPWWGPYRGWAYNAYGGITAWGPGGWAATSGNVYHQWGNWGAVTRGAAGYNAFTGNEWASRYGTAYNSRTGAMAAGRSGAVENVYTGNYAKGREGAGYNPNTGIGVAAKGGTIGNVDTGKSVSGKEVKVVNTNTGKTVTAGDIKGADGSAGHVGNDAFATHDGNVYVNKDGGGWHQVTPPEPQRTTSTQDFSQLDRERQARSTGEQRTASFQSARPQGGFQGGGFRGGRR